MFKFICFGSGSSGNCYYFQSAEGGFLIDIGIGVRALKKHFYDNGLSFSAIKAIFVTHEHADHVKAVGVIANELNVPVYATEAVHAGMQRNYCMSVKPKEELRRVMDKGSSINIAGFRIASFAVPHDSVENVGYLIECENRNFCLVTDAGFVTDEMKKNIKKADFLVVEANYDAEMLKMGPYPQYLKDRIGSHTGHLCNIDTAKLLAENGFDRLKKVWLCHLSEENNHPELARKTIESYLQGQGYLVGTDVEIMVLRRKVPSECYLLK